MITDGFSLSSFALINFPGHRLLLQGQPKVRSGHSRGTLEACMCRSFKKSRPFFEMLSWI